jgi:PAS domain S-box-containing protein
VKRRPKSQDNAADLRAEAEDRWLERQAGRSVPGADVDTQRLLHELEVHQIELEMQNVELQRARVEVEAALEKYTELYDFAPVGYFSIDRQGLIQEVNLTGATMLGMARSRVLQRRLRGFAAPMSRPVVDAFLETVFAKPGKQACEALLMTGTGAAFWADLQASSEPLCKGEKNWCRLAVSDIAALKRGEDAQRHVESLAAANQEADREIARRRGVEASLRESEQTQRELLAKSRELQAQLRNLTHQILLAQEEERKQISRQLHDEIAQILVGINVQLAALSETAAIDPRELRRRIAATARMVGQSIVVVHRFARNLRPALLDDLGLVPALRSLIKELTQRKRLSVHLTAYAGVEALDSIHRTVLYRVAQEALINIVRHAEARSATLRILKIPGAVRLEIHDNGRSFPAERMIAAKRDGHLGLVGMRERVEMVGGRFAIKSAPGKGTTVTAEIPLDVPPGGRRRSDSRPPMSTVATAGEAGLLLA